MNIVWLGEPAGQDVPSVGGKVANLSRLAGAHRVPPGFCLTTAAFRQWSKGGDDDAFPPELRSQLDEAYGEMGRRTDGRRAKCGRALFGHR